MITPHETARCTGMDAPLCQRCRRRKPGDPSKQIDIQLALTLNGCDNFIGYHIFNMKNKNIEVRAE